MPLSTKARYGTRAILDLALGYGEGPITLGDIANHQEISKKYLERLIVSLKSAGLEKSIRGTHGGYILASPPTEITLDVVVQVLEGSLAPVECVDDPHFCHRIRFCAAHDVWWQMKRAMEFVLKSTTLEDLAERQKAKEQSEGRMYYI